jgi:hypothetical protein
VNVFFDNCTSPVFASTLNGFIEHDGHSGVHIRDLRGLSNGRNSKDLEWIDFLRQSNDEWMFISGDGRILKNPAERVALRSAGLHGFILAPPIRRRHLTKWPRYWCGAGRKLCKSPGLWPHPPALAQVVGGRSACGTLPHEEGYG